MRSNKTSAWIDEHVHLFSCVHKNISCLHPAAAGLQLYNLVSDHMSGSCGRSTVSKQQRRLHVSTRISESRAETKGPAVRWPLCSNSNGFDPLSVWDCVCCRPSKAANFRQQFLGVTEVETWVCTMLKASSHLCSVIWGVTVETTGQQHDQVTVLSWTQWNVYKAAGSYSIYTKGARFLMKPDTLLYELWLVDKWTAIIFLLFMHKDHIYWYSDKYSGQHWMWR